MGPIRAIRATIIGFNPCKSGHLPGTRLAVWSSEGTSGLADTRGSSVHLPPAGICPRSTRHTVTCRTTHSRCLAGTCEVRCSRQSTHALAGRQGSRSDRSRPLCCSTCRQGRPMSVATSSTTTQIWPQTQQQFGAIRPPQAASSRTISHGQHTWAFVHGHSSVGIHSLLGIQCTGIPSLTGIHLAGRGPAHTEITSRTDEHSAGGVRAEVARVAAPVAVGRDLRPVLKCLANRARRAVVRVIAVQCAERQPMRALTLQQREPTSNGGW